MKIDFPPVRCFDEAAIFPGEEVLDAVTYGFEDRGDNCRVDLPRIIA